MFWCAYSLCFTMCILVLDVFSETLRMSGIRNIKTKTLQKFDYSTCRKCRKPEFPKRKLQSPEGGLPLLSRIHLRSKINWDFLITWRYGEVCRGSGTNPAGDEYSCFEVFGEVVRGWPIAKPIQNIIPMAVLKPCRTLRNILWTTLGSNTNLCA